MKKRLLALLLTAVCVLTLLPAAEATALVPCMTVDDTLLFIGDSNTVALKSYNPDLNPARVYARVSGRIDECVENWSRYHAYGYDQGIYQLLCALSGEDFDTVVINMGTNNIGLSLTKFHDDYGQLLHNLYEKNPAAVIYVCLILPTNPAHGESSYTPAAVARINEQVAAVRDEYAALGYDVRLLDLNTPFADSSGVLLSEYDSGGGVHLTANGYRRMDRIIQTALAQGDPAANHSWGEPTTALEPTCTEPGRRETVCTACGAVIAETLPATGHRWDSTWVSIPADCEHQGTLGFQCSVCGEKRYEYYPALGHLWALTQTLTEGETPHECTALYTCTRCAGTKEAPLCAGEVFTDMPPEGNWAHEPIDWAWLNGITAGKTATSFAPKAEVTRGEAMTFLWTAQGRPAPDPEQENPFTDVKEGKYYYSPVLWAVQNGVTGGTGDGTTFSPKASCTRAQIVTFLWTLAGRPEPETEENPFDDVAADKYYYQAVLWAAETGITGGTAPGRFSPNSTCTRAQILAFLYHK